MEIIVAKNSGFCGGVLNTVNKCEEYLKKYHNAYILGDIVHNNLVIGKLKKEGLVTVNNINEIEESSTVIIRAHGERKDIYELLKRKNNKIIDLTCPKVKKIHDLIIEHSNSFVVVIGKKNHAEVLGHISYANKYFIIEDNDDIDELLKEISRLKVTKLYIVSQTTFNDKLFDEIVCVIKDKCQNITVEVDKTICNVTKIRQDEIRELSKNVDKVIIIGDKKSSNTKELVKVAKENCIDTYLVTNIDDLVSININKDDKIGISAGASTPKEIINDVKNYLQSFKNSL